MTDRQTELKFTKNFKGLFLKFIKYNGIVFLRFGADMPFLGIEAMKAWKAVVCANLFALFYKDYSQEMKTVF